MCVLVGPEEEEIEAVMQPATFSDPRDHSGVSQTERNGPSGLGRGQPGARIDQRERDTVYMLFLMFRQEHAGECKRWQLCPALVDIRAKNVELKLPLGRLEEDSGPCRSAL